MLIIDRLSVERGNNKVLVNLSQSMEPGKIHGIVGLNGAGKTTLLETLFGFLKPKEGSIKLNNEKLTNKKIAYLEAHPFFYSRITGMDYLRIFQKQNKLFDIQEWGNLYKIPLEKLIEQYSSGMKKKLAFLATMSFNSPVYLLDEPFNSMDLETVEITKIVLKKLKEKNKIIILTSHIIESMTVICDEIYVLSGGNFQKKYNKIDFDKLDPELFSLLRESNEIMVNKLL